MRKLKQTGQKEIGRIKLTNTRELVASLVDGEKLDLRVWIETKDYRGLTKRDLRFYRYDGIWEELKNLIAKADKIYEEIA